MRKSKKTIAADHLFAAILTLKNKEECYLFFEDLCTPNELSSLSQRYEVAKLVSEGKTYVEIAEATGASTATISRVSRSINEGYDIVFSRL
ncbi:MAG: helix-turn-helix domain-containing protein [Lachnospiraceae bacterium]|jgi:TrpR-related protein YerC/YecD|nr:helix-turn-helix domain-containing protein [Lachnospiraceae bacterium]